MADRQFEGLPRLLRMPGLDRTAETLAPARRHPVVTESKGGTYGLTDSLARQRVAHGGSEGTVHSLLQLQRQYGNRYVEQVIARARQGGESDEVHPSVETSIHQQRGGGQHLDGAVKRQMEGAMGADFSGVRIHTDAKAHTLNHALSARAFTTGQDIFFRQGAYQPGSFVGRELLAHELTHVVQQNGAQVSRKMSVSQPGDAHELEAEQTAHSVMQRELHHTMSGETAVSREEDKGQEMAMTCPSKDEAQRQPESLKEEDEKKHHLAKSMGGSGVARAEDEQTG